MIPGSIFTFAIRTCLSGVFKLNAALTASAGGVKSKLV
jgi:hypothetical protein